MSSVTIIGAGNMAGAIAGIARKSGADVQIVARDAAKVAELAAVTGATSAAYGDTLTGDIVILAVPYPAVDSIIATYADALDGAIVVDITNPLDFSTFDSLVTPADSSAAAVLAAALPGAKVVKAFNTTFAATLATGNVGSVETTVLVAGDDADAKQAVIDLVIGGESRPSTPVRSSVRVNSRHSASFSSPSRWARRRRGPAASPSRVSHHE